jgi:hypothetical protein
MTNPVDTRPRTAVQQQLNGMGDLVWHAQYYRCVAEQSQGGQVSLIAPPTAMARELIGHEPWVREVIDFDRRPRRSERRKGRHSGLFGLLRFGAELRRSSSTAWCCFLITRAAPSSSAGGPASAPSLALATAGCNACC